jgi:4-hydroxy-tetrahydrodipicolinate synthase
VYVKSDKVWTPAAIEQLVKEGLVVAVKYAIVRENPEEDAFLTDLCARISPKMIISGIGERPAAAHFDSFGVAGFTSGSVCVAPRLSTTLLQSLHAGDRAKADSIREHFMALEDLRDGWSPIRTMHEAVTLSGVGNMGPMLPMLSNLSEAEGHDLGALKKAARQLLADNAAAQSKAKL